MIPATFALYRLILFLLCISIYVYALGGMVLVMKYGYVIKPYPLAGLGCCAALLGWWGYNNARGPDLGIDA